MSTDHSVISSEKINKNQVHTKALGLVAHKQIISINEANRSELLLWKFKARKFTNDLNGENIEKT